MADTENEFQNGSLLNKEEQQLVEAFRGIGGGPMHVLPRKNPEVINRPTVLLREVVAEYYHSSVLNKPLVAAFNCPTPDKLDSRKYFCEACTIPVPAREQDWQTHAAGVVHKWQMLSLCMLGELSHQPARVTGMEQSVASNCLTTKPDRD